LSRRFGVLPGFLIIFWMTPSIAWLNVTNSDTSLAIISASTRMAVLICASPPLSASKPARISSRNRVFDGVQRAVSAPRRDSSQIVSESILLAGEPDLPRMPAMSCSIADIAGFILRFALIHSIDPVWIPIELAPIGKSRKATG
jgi:hypothetical protein